jgi:hypothetical protein
MDRLQRDGELRRTGEAYDGWEPWTWRWSNALRDLWARLRGRCCAAPMPGDGGYVYWRCGLRRGHAGRHESGRGESWGEGAWRPGDGGTAVLLKRHPTENGRQRRARLANEQRVADVRSAIKAASRDIARVEWDPDEDRPGAMGIPEGATLAEVEALMRSRVTATRGDA